MTAAGGTGKTRLALAVGEIQLESRQAGVWFVDLTAVSGDELVPEAIARVVNLVLASGDATTQVVDYLANQDALLILDNCEHVIDACADFVESFLARTGTARILATTREFLDVDGERAIRLTPLDVEGDSSAAAQLFIERAIMADSAFEPDETDHPLVAALCRHLDGSPLAIELAAARSNVMSPSELLNGLGERFELLSGGRRRRSKRALEDTLNWSYQLLDEEEQWLLRQLGIFVGSFDIDAVVSTTGRAKHVVLDLIDSLISKSLVVSERQADRLRFSLQETTAAYAERALDDAGEVSNAATRHLDHYLAVCAPYDVGCWASRQPATVLLDRDNIRAAVRWASRIDRWADPGRLTFSASTALQSQPEDLMALTKDCMTHLGAVDLSTTLGLRSVRTYTSIQFDFAEPSADVELLHQSTDPFENALGHMWRGFFEFHFEPVEVCLVTFAENPNIGSQLPDGAAKRQILSAIEVITGWAMANIGCHHEAREHQRNAQRHLMAHAPETTLMAEASASEGVAHVLLNDSAAALAVADRLDQLHYMYFDGTEVRAAALIAAGAVEQALPYVCQHAEDGVTGRLSRMANNSLLLLALVAEAGGDITRAADLLMSVEPARNPMISVSIELANRLEIRPAFDRSSKASSPDQRASGRRAIRELRR